MYEGSMLNHGLDGFTIRRSPGKGGWLTILTQLMCAATFLLSTPDGLVYRILLAFGHVWNHSQKRSTRRVVFDTRKPSINKYQTQFVSWLPLFGINNASHLESYFSSSPVSRLLNLTVLCHRRLNLFSASEMRSLAPALGYKFL